MGDFEKAMEDSRKAGDAKIKMECITDCVDYLNKLRTQFTDDFESAKGDADAHMHLADKFEEIVRCEVDAIDRRIAGMRAILNEEPVFVYTDDDSSNAFE